jgi:hypothetical protein
MVSSDFSGLRLISPGSSDRVELVFGTETIAFDPVEQILELLADLGAEDRAGWSGVAQSERVSGLARMVERAQAELIRATSTWDGAGAWAEDGATSPVAWLAQRVRIAGGGAARLVRSARLVRRHERTAKALASGDITSGHVEVLAVKTARHKRLFAEHEDTLLDAATALGVDEFETAAESWRLLADELRTNSETDQVRK